MEPDPSKKTAKELADELGVSVSTVTRRYAEPRDEYIAKARARENRALHLKDVEKLSDKDVAEKMGLTYYSAIGLIKRARRRRQAEQDAVAGDD